MMDYEALIKKLEDESNRVDCTDAQREANKWRINYLKLVNRPKTPETPYKPLDPVSERLRDKDYTMAPNRLLGE
jgi:hypothetical protein